MATFSHPEYLYRPDGDIETLQALAIVGESMFEGTWTGLEIGAHSLAEDTKVKGFSLPQGAQPGPAAFPI